MKKEWGNEACKISKNASGNLNLKHAFLLQKQKQKQKTNKHKK
jgi:hypothetical protein